MGFFDQLKDAVASMSLDETKEQSVNREFTQSQPVVKQSAPTGLYDPQLENLIDIALADGELTEKKKQVLFNKAESMGIDHDEFEMVLDARLAKLQKSEKSASASNKLGEIKKCPACGSIVKGGMAVCEDCGYAFDNVGPTRTAERLFEELQKIDRPAEDPSKYKGSNPLLKVVDSFTRSEDSDIEKAQKKMDLIAAFPVPNTRADLLDTLTSIQGKVNSKAPKQAFDLEKRQFSTDLGYAYWQLYSNCINKAKISFSEDKDFQPYFVFYEQELAKSEKRPKRFGLF